MIQPNEAPIYAVMNRDNNLVWAANHFAFYKTLKHAEEKVSRNREEYRVVKVVYEEV